MGNLLTVMCINLSGRWESDLCVVRVFPVWLWAWMYMYINSHCLLCDYVYGRILYYVSIC